MQKEEVDRFAAKSRQQREDGPARERLAQSRAGAAGGERQADGVHDAESSGGREMK